MSIKAGEQTDFQSQMKYHHLLNSLKIETRSDLRIQNVIETEPGCRSPSTDSPRDPCTTSWTDEADGEDKKRDNTLILLDWDDTLFPTNWMTGILANTQNGMAMVNDDDIASLNRLGQLTLSLLSDLIVKYGANNIVIVTNSMEGWIKDSLNYASCISNVYKEIESVLIKHDITMDSAQTLYAKKDEESSTPTQWKQLCFDSILSGTKTRESYAHIVSIGDQWTDHFAAKQCIDSLNRYCPIHHMIKLKAKPSVSDMNNEILYVQTCFLQIFDVISSSQCNGNCKAVVVDYHREEMKYYSSLNVNNEE